MLVTFTTKNHANVLMFGDIAITLLKMMGHSGTVPSAILAKDIPEAVQRLNAALELHKSPPPDADQDSGAKSVSLAHRALPLIDLLNTAAANDEDVLWR